MTKMFTVSGRGEFPYDMLRYDQCEFISESDKTLAGIPQHHRYVTLMFLPNARKELYGPTVARWESFGWSVTVRE